MARIKIRELELQGKNVTRWTMVLDLKNMNAVSNVNPASKLKKHLILHQS
jgi:hypothetical protein